MGRNINYILLLILFGNTSLLAQIRFTDVTESSGIDHQYKVFEGLFGGGACVIDINKDGFEDLYITSGMADDRLYLNNRDGTFKDIFEGSGFEITRNFVTQGVVSADVNKDGWSDIFITTTTRRDTTLRIPRAINLLFLNNGDNTFSDATESFGLDQYFAFSTGATFGDFNGDGFPDLYVGNYFLEYDGPLTEINDATIVNASKTAKGFLFLNKNGKKFVNVYEKYGLIHKGFGFGGLFTDYDNDGDQDLIINHDFGYKAKPNYLLRNEFPEKKFTYVEEDLEMDLRINSMGTARGDYNNDGFLDYFFTNIKFNRFMKNHGPDKPFENVAKNIGTYIFTISWGANFCDFDHDGDLDLFVVNGDLNPNCTPMGNFMFENDAGRFEDKGMASGIKDFGMGRGSVIFDIENDGDMDVLFINQEPIKDYPVPSITKLFRNDSTYGNWIKIQLQGNSADKNGIGSRVSIFSGGNKQIREVDGGGSSHISNNSKVAHFGLGDAEVIDSIIVDWTGGDRQILINQGVNKMIIIDEPERVNRKVELYSVFIFLVLFTAYFIFRRRQRKNDPDKKKKSFFFENLYDPEE